MVSRSKNSDNTMNDSEQTKELLEKALDIAGRNRKTLAEAIGVSVDSIYKWLKENRNIKKENQKKLEDYIYKHTSYGTILQKPALIHVAEPLKPDFVYIPFLNDHFQITEERFPFQLDYLTNEYSFSQYNFIMYRNLGLQMKPLFSSGDILLIDTSRIELIPTKIYLISYNNTLYVRRFFYNHSAYIFKVENKEFELQNIIVEKKDDVLVIGQVLWFSSTELMR